MFPTCDITKNVHVRKPDYVHIRVFASLHLIEEKIEQENSYHCVADREAILRYQ